MTAPFPSLNYWCALNKDLDVVAQALEPIIKLHDVQFDAENLYEWFTATDAAGRRWNVSRRHNAGESDYSDRLRIVLMPVPDDEEEVGQLLARALSCRVSFGKVTYLKGDEWDYEEHKSFSSSAEQS